MAGKAVGAAFEKGGSLAAAGAAGEGGDRVADADEVVAVDGKAGNAVAFGAPGDGAGADARGGRRGHGVAVRLADGDERELPEGGEVQRLVDDALVGGAVAEEGGDHAVALLKLRVEGEAGGEGDAGAGDAVRAVEAQFGRHHHLAAAATARVAALTAEEFGEEAARVGAAREEVAVAAVGAGQRVVRAQGGGDADGDGLLADAGVRRADDAAFGEELLHRLLETADEQHVAIGFE